MIEAEEATDERPVPEQVVEGAEQDGGPRRPVELGVRADDHLGASVLELDATDEPLLHELVDVAADASRSSREPAVLRDARFGERASALHGAQGENGAGARPRWARAASSAVARDHALAEVVQPLERAPPRDRDLAGREQMLEGALGRLPAPHPFTAAFERARRERPLLADPREHLALEGSPLRRALASPPVPIGEVAHPAFEHPVVPRSGAGRLRGPSIRRSTPRAGAARARGRRTHRSGSRV